MRVKYVKNGPSGKIGETRNHTLTQARALIKLGIVVPADTATEKPINQAFGNLPKVSADTNANPKVLEKDAESASTPSKRGRPKKVG